MAGKYVKSLERDIIGSKGKGYKRLKKLQLEANDQTHTKIIPQVYWNTSLFNADNNREGAKEMAESIKYEWDKRREEPEVVLKRNLNIERLPAWMI